jgi:hypothetical protein
MRTEGPPARGGSAATEMGGSAPATTALSIRSTTPYSLVLVAAIGHRRDIKPAPLTGPASHQGAPHRLPSVVNRWLEGVLPGGAA